LRLIYARKKIVTPTRLSNTSARLKRGRSFRKHRSKKGGAYRVLIFSATTFTEWITPFFSQTKVALASPQRKL
jgi:hypothetical protein